MLLDPKAIETFRAQQTFLAPPRLQHGQIKRAFEVLGSAFQLEPDHELLLPTLNLVLGVGEVQRRPHPAVGGVGELGQLGVRRDVVVRARFLYLFEQI